MSPHHSNHLDFETIEAMIKAIKEYQGGKLNIITKAFTLLGQILTSSIDFVGVLIVSHDQHLLTSVCDDLYVVHEGDVELLRHGSNSQDAFEHYKRDVVAGRR